MGVDFSSSRNSLFMPFLSCVPSFNFLLYLLLVKKFVVVVVVWCGGRVAEAYLSVQLS